MLGSPEPPFAHESAAANLSAKPILELHKNTLTTKDSALAEFFIKNCGLQNNSVSWAKSLKNVYKAKPSSIHNFINITNLLSE